jgi:hypothetical protein
MLGLIVAGMPTAYAGLTVLDWTCIAIIAGCVQTIAVRLKRILAALRETSPLPLGEGKGEGSSR